MQLSITAYDQLLSDYEHVAHSVHTLSGLSQQEVFLL